MSPFPFRCPAPPAWNFDWAGLTEEFEWIRALRDCPQDPLFHAEGNVWIHLRMVCEALAGLAEFRTLPEFERHIVFAAGLLHDVAKPPCTRYEGGRITSRGHSRLGAITARRILWEFGVDFMARELVCALIRYHQLPFHFLNRPDAQRTVFLISQTARCDLLALLARADALGRECSSQADVLTNVELFRQLSSELGCMRGPKQFPSGYSRFLYFRTPGRDPAYVAHDDAKCNVTVMSGLPASGKDTWIAEHLPGAAAISLDAIREESGAARTGNQGRVVQAARDKARGFLRAGEIFIWNATNLSRELRAKVAELIEAYHARGRIVYVETDRATLLAQNRSRPAVVPAAAIDRMMERWEVPDPIEAAQVEWWIAGTLIGSGWITQDA